MGGPVVRRTGAETSCADRQHVTAGISEPRSRGREPQGSRSFCFSGRSDGAAGRTPHRGPRPTPSDRRRASATRKDTRRDEQRSQQPRRPPAGDAGPPRRPDAGPDDERPRRPDLRDDELRVRRRRARGAPVRAPGVRQHLHPDHEPDDRTCSSSASPRSRAASAALALSVRPGGRDAVDPQPRPGRRQHRQLVSSLYGGTYNLFHYTLPKLGITVTFVDGSDPASFGRAIDEQDQGRLPRDDRQPAARRRTTSRRSPTSAARAGRAGHRRQHVRAAARQADRARRRHRHPLGDEVDRRPRHGDRRRRRRRRHLRLGGQRAVQARTSSTPDPSLPRRSATPRRSGNLAFILKLRVQGLRDIGAALSPFNAFLFLQGLETLPLRIERHSENALAVAQWLRGPARGRRGSATRASSRTRPTSSPSATSSGGFGGIVTFGVKGGVGGRPAAHRQRQDLQPAGQRRRREGADHPPGLDDALAARRRGAGGDRRHRGPRPAVGRASSTSTTSSPTSTRRSRAATEPVGRRASS